MRRFGRKEMADNTRRVQKKVAQVLQKELAAAAEIVLRETRLIEAELSNPESYLKPEHGQRFETRVVEALRPLEKHLNKLSCLGEASASVREGYRSIVEDVSLVRNISNLSRDVQDANRDLFLTYYVKDGILPCHKVIAAMETLKSLSEDGQSLAELKTQVSC